MDTEVLTILKWLILSPLNNKEFGMEEHYVGVVVSTSSMVCPAREHVQFTHRLSRPVREREVEAREIEGPARLVPVKRYNAAFLYCKN